jgi:hypothetical protein
MILIPVAAVSQSTNVATVTVLRRTDRRHLRAVPLLGPERTEMTDPKKYWLTDGAGEFALVNGADERDRLTPFGWVATDEPTDGWVYIWRDGIAEPGRVPVTAVETLWGPLGWSAGPPPDGVHPFTPQPSAEPVAESKTSKPAAGGDVKEK